MLSSSEEESGIPWQVVTAASPTSNDVPMNEEEIGGSLSDSQSSIDSTSTTDATTSEEDSAAGKDGSSTYCFKLFLTNQ
jgi:hypothetical protein